MRIAHPPCPSQRRSSRMEMLEIRHVQDLLELGPVALTKLGNNVKQRAAEAARQLILGTRHAERVADTQGVSTMRRPPTRTEPRQHVRASARGASDARSTGLRGSRGRCPSDSWPNEPERHFLARWGLGHHPVRTGIDLLW